MDRERRPCGVRKEAALGGCLFVAQGVACIVSGMKTRVSGAIVIASLFAGGLLAAQSTSQTSLLILSKRGHTLAIVDPSSLKVLSRVPVGDDPHEVIASADGRTAYVSNYGGGSLRTVAVGPLGEQKADVPD